MQAASVFALVVQHCPDEALGIQSVCSLLQVSTACRTALQQSRGNCSVTIRSQSAAAGLVAWLPRHAGLLQELHFPVATVGGPSILAELAVAMQTVTDSSRSEEGSALLPGRAA
jgi:hypothetical protein